jgi:hypothetical protein
VSLLIEARLEYRLHHIAMEEGELESIPEAGIAGMKFLAGDRPTIAGLSLASSLFPAMVTRSDPGLAQGCSTLELLLLKNAGGDDLTRCCDSRHFYRFSAGRAGLIAPFCAKGAALLSGESIGRISGPCLSP